MDGQLLMYFTSLKVCGGQCTACSAAQGASYGIILYP